ncbi:MAG: zinc ribbon domain-containing protein [Lentisphaerae bacterium]|nr:zinc ribbon domain-containing protein [Lentisphaerota bacterium]
MPIFEYECGQCRKRFEYLARNPADTPKICPQCGHEKLSKVFSAFSVGAERAPTGPSSPPASACSTCTSDRCPYGER